MKADALNNHWLESKIRRFRQESLYYFQKILYNISIAGKTSYKMFILDETI